MTWSGLILLVLILLIAAWFWYAYTNRKMDAGLIVRMWQARRKGADRLHTVLKRSAREQAERQTPARSAGSARRARPALPIRTVRTARPFLQTAHLLAETGTIGDVDGPDVSTADLRAKRLPSPQTLSFLRQGSSSSDDRPAYEFAGDDTGTLAETHLQVAYTNPAYDPQETASNVAKPAPAESYSSNNSYDSYVEPDGDMHHDAPSAGLLDPEQHSDKADATEKKKRTSETPSSF